MVWAVLSPVIAEGPGPTISVIAVMKLSPNDEFDARGALERHYRARIFFNFFETHLYDREFQYEHVAVLESCPL